MNRKGMTTGNLKLRAGPGMDKDVLAYLEANTQLDILDDTGEWLHVRVGGKEGYVGSKYVSVVSLAASAPAPAPPSTPSGMRKSDHKPAGSTGGASKAHKGVEEK